MPKPRNSGLESPTARRKQALRKKPYWATISPGVSLGYRRNQGAGTWSVKATDGHGGEWTKRIGLADDFEASDGRIVLTYWQAIDAARVLARGGDEDDGGKPTTIAAALDAYEADLLLRGAHPYNAAAPRGKLSASLLAKPVQLVTEKELRAWRNALANNGLTASSVNRTCKGLRAALILAASLDSRITHSRAWKVGLAALPDANPSRGDVVLTDAQVVEIIACARKVDPHYGLFVAVLALGVRASQAARLLVRDLQPGRLMMPSSKKGRRTKTIRHTPVPISPALEALLVEQARGRPADAPLLTDGRGEPWGHSRDGARPRALFRETVARAGLDPDKVVPYALRHSAIVRMLKRNLPIRLVAALVDSSAAIIEKNYAAFIAHHSDELARTALIDA
jgi:integrase